MYALVDEYVLQFTTAGNAVLLFQEFNDTELKHDDNAFVKVLDSPSILT